MASKIEPIYADLGKRIRKARDSKTGMTQEKLGNLLQPSMTRVSIANIESGNQRVLTHTLVQIAQILEVELTELVPGKKANGIPKKPDIANELVKKIGLSKKFAKEILENPQALKARMESKS